MCLSSNFMLNHKENIADYEESMRQITRIQAPQRIGLQL